MYATGVIPNGYSDLAAMLLANSCPMYDQTGFGEYSCFKYDLHCGYLWVVAKSIRTEPFEYHIIFAEVQSLTTDDETMRIRAKNAMGGI